MKKKIIAGIMSMMMVAAMVVPVSATGNNKVEVIYTEDNTYVLSIPTTVDLDKDGGQADILATKVNIEPNKELRIRVADKQLTPEGEVTLKREDASQTTTSRVSLVKDGKDGIDTTTIITSYKEQDDDVSSGGKIYFGALEDDLQAGIWKGTITFSASIEPSTP